MKLRPRAKAFLLVALLAFVLYAALLGARIIHYSGGSYSGLRSSALYNAVQKDDATAVLVLLLTGADPNRPRPNYGHLPLDLAARQGNRRIVSLLLHAGAGPEGLGGMFARPLFYAASRQDHEMADILFKRGAHYAVVDALFLGDWEGVERVLAKNANVLRDTSYKGNSLLIMAMEFDRLDMARFLLESGLDPTEWGRGGGRSSVLERATQRGQQEFVELFKTSVPKSIDTPREMH